MEKDDGLYLHIQVRHPSNNIQNCNVIFVHGFLGDGIENHRMFIKIADALNEVGYTCILFDQTGCGYSDGDYRDVRLETLKKDLAELIKWVKYSYVGDIAFVGQSLGSALVIATVNELNVSFKIAINPAAHFDKWLLKRYNWDLTSHNDFFCAIPKGIFVSRKFIIDLIKWKWTEKMCDNDTSILFVVSTNDGIGSYEVAKQLLGEFGDKANLIAIYNAEHSFTNQPQLENYAVNSIVKWISTKGHGEV